MENVDNSEKTIEELAREAMNAIKESEKREELKNIQEERNALNAQELLKQEATNKIKRKLRELQKKEVEKAKETIDTRFMVNWKSMDKYGINYNGEYNEKITFKIKKGLYLYHLYVVDANLDIEPWQKSTCTSSNLDVLKKKADTILSNSENKNQKIT